MKCSNCDKELVKDITGNNGLKRTLQCECLRLESFYDIEGPGWLFDLANDVAYRLDKEPADKFKDKFKELLKTIKDEEELKQCLIVVFRNHASRILVGLLRKEYKESINCLHDEIVTSDKLIVDELYHLGHSLKSYAYMIKYDDINDLLHCAWGVDYDSFGNKKSFEQSAIKYAELIIETMEKANDPIP